MADVDPKVRDLINAYLIRHKDRLRYVSVDSAMLEVRLWVLAAAKLSDADLRSIVVGFYIVYGVQLPMVVNQPSTLADNKIVKAVKGAVTTVIDGIDIKRADGKINIGIKGLTGELQKKGGTVSATIGWTGTLTVEATKGNFHFSGELSKDKWELKLSYPEDTAVPDYTKLGKVFGEGEKALHGIIKETKDIKDLKDIPKVAGKFSPHIDAVKEAVEAAQGIAKAPKKGLSFGFKVGSPDPSPGQEGTPKGVQGVFVITYKF